MSQKTIDEKIMETETKLKQLKAREKEIRKRETEAERKKRTRRLIELGAIVESVLGRPTTDSDKIKFEAFLRKQEKSGKYFSRAMNREIKLPNENAEKTN